jgi:methyl-accepting chemotaxis protein
MGRTAGSISDVMVTGEETPGIMQTIEETAFLANLLALNVAAEIGCSGEGAEGFAAVAGDLQNLALRLAGAARETGNLIAGAKGRQSEISAQAEEMEDIVNELISLIRGHVPRVH